MVLTLKSFESSFLEPPGIADIAENYLKTPQLRNHLNLLLNPSERGKQALSPGAKQTLKYSKSEDSFALGQSKAQPQSTKPHKKIIKCTPK